jgi:hypothetical protein
MSPRLEFASADFYRILQVDPAAHPEVVRAAYRTLLRVLGKHPDLGGDPAEATSIIEAYRTLSDGHRRAAYDQWLRAHSIRKAPPAITVPAPATPAPVVEPAPVATRPRPAPAPGVLNWVRDALGDFRIAPRVRFARSFDVVFERPTWLAPRVYTKVAGEVGRAEWPTLFVLAQAIRVGREGSRPSLDVLLVVADRAEAPDAFAAEAARHAAPRSWNRTAIALCTLSPVRLWYPALWPTPRVLRRLRRALPHLTSR